MFAVSVLLTPASVSTTVAPASALPLMTEFCSVALMMLSRATVWITGATGATVSTSIKCSPVRPTLPARSVAVALMSSLPWPMAVISADNSV